MCSLHQNLGCPLITLCLTAKAKSPHSSFSHYCAYPANTFVYHMINKIGKLMRLHKNSVPLAQEIHTETTAWTQAVLVARILSPFQHRDTSPQATHLPKCLRAFHIQVILRSVIPNTSPRPHRIPQGTFQAQAASTDRAELVQPCFSVFLD